MAVAADVTLTGTIEHLAMEDMTAIRESPGLAVAALQQTQAPEGVTGGAFGSTSFTVLSVTATVTVASGMAQCLRGRVCVWRIFSPLFFFWGGEASTQWPNACVAESV